MSSGRAGGSASAAADGERINRMPLEQVPDAQFRQDAPQPYYDFEASVAYLFREGEVRLLPCGGVIPGGDTDQPPAERCAAAERSAERREAPGRRPTRAQLAAQLDEALAMALELSQKVSVLTGELDHAKSRLRWSERALREMLSMFVIKDIGSGWIRSVHVSEEDLARWRGVLLWEMSA